MRTLTRPMFNMGGPIKQGVMHGIREPYRGGGQAALVGNPVYPRTGGREHHFAVSGTLGATALIWPHIARLLGGQALKKGITSVTQGQLFKKGIQESVKKAAGTGAGAGAGTGTAAAAPVYTGLKGYFMNDPLVKSALWAKRALMNPTTAGWGKSALRFAASPSTVIGGVVWYLWPDGSKRKTPPPDDMKQPGHGDEGMFYDKTKKVLSDAERAAFAKKQQDIRVKKYLDMMGYDRSKKTAIADALIDASRIVGERGTLDPKNITQELINPIIQATSKRLDKPEQIREAVGLMMTKAGLEKEMYEAKPGTVAKNVQDMVKSGQFTEEEAWAIATKGSQGVVQDIQGALASGKIGEGGWIPFLRATGAQHGEDVSVITTEQLKETYGDDTKKHPSGMEIITEREKTEIVPDGIYQIGGDTIRIKNGKKTQLR